MTTDQLVEDIHFLKEKISPFDLGYKSLAVNLSDIAGMGGAPLYAFLSLALPEDTEIAWLDEFFKGWKKLSRKVGVHLLGGDTTRSPDKLVINVVVLGKGEKRFIKYRAGALPGDVITVTGYLGDAEGGLRLLMHLDQREKKGWAEKYLCRRHLLPRPHLEEGKFLARRPEVHAMMDISDGLASDLRRIIERSGCGAEIQVDKLPLSPALKKCSRQYGWSPSEVAVAGGEDYCLLLAVEPRKFPQLAADFWRRFGWQLPLIGRITAKKGNLVYFQENKPVTFPQSGFNHFQK